MCWSVLFPCPKCQKRAAKRKKTKARANVEASAKFGLKLTEVLDEYSIRKDNTNISWKHSGRDDTCPALSQGSQPWDKRSWSVPAGRQLHELGAHSLAGKAVHDPSKCTCPCSNCIAGSWERFKQGSCKPPTSTASPSIRSPSYASTSPSDSYEEEQETPTTLEPRYRTCSDWKTWSASALAGSPSTVVSHDRSVADEAPKCQGDYPRMYIYPCSSPAVSFPVVDFTKNQESDYSTPYLAYAIVPTSVQGRIPFREQVDRNRW